MNILLQYRTLTLFLCSSCYFLNVLYGVQSVRYCTEMENICDTEPEPLSHLPFFGGMKMGLCVLIGKDQRFLDLSEITIFDMLCLN